MPGNLSEPVVRTPGCKPSYLCHIGPQTTKLASWHVDSDWCADCMTTLVTVTGLGLSTIITPMRPLTMVCSLGHWPSQAQHACRFQL